MKGETVVRLRGTPIVGAYSGEATDLDWDAPGELPIITLAPVEPRPSSEPVEDARNAVVSGWTLYLPAGADVTAADKMRVRGIDYPVQGEPAVWGTRGVVVQTYKTEG